MSEHHYFTCDVCGEKMKNPYAVIKKVTMKYENRIEWHEHDLCESCYKKIFEKGNKG